MNRWERLEYKPAPLFAPTYGPLSGMRVLLNGTVVAAPFTATMLSDFGAEVIALERPKTLGDPARHQKPQIIDGDKSISCAWTQNARNKLSFSFETNMKVPESRDIFLSLIKNVDVWIENMVWIEKLGLTDEMLLEVNPKLIIAHINGYGTPRFGGLESELNRPSYDPIGQSESGFAILQGFPDRPPTFATQAVGDFVCALMAVNGILAAYNHRHKTGKGQIVESTLGESWMRVLDDCYSAWCNLGVTKERIGVHHPVFQPGGVFECKDGRFVNLGSFGAGAYYKVLKAFNIDAEKYSYEKAGGTTEAINSPLGRELHNMFKKFFMEHTADEASEICKQYKIGLGVVRTTEEAYNDEHWHLRNDFLKYEDQTLGREVEAFGIHPKLSATPGKVWRGAPALGQDTERILRDLLDYSDTDIANLAGKGVID